MPGLARFRVVSRRLTPAAACRALAFPDILERVTIIYAKRGNTKNKKAVVLVFRGLSSRQIRCFSTKRGAGGSLFQYHPNGT